MKISKKWKRRLKIVVLLVLAYFCVSWWRAWQRERYFAKVEEFKAELRAEGLRASQDDHGFEVSEHDAELMRAYYAAETESTRNYRRVTAEHIGVHRATETSCIPAWVVGDNDPARWQEIQSAMGPIDEAVRILDELPFLLHPRDLTDELDYVSYGNHVAAELSYRIKLALAFGHEEVAWRDLVSLTSLIAKQNSWKFPAQFVNGHNYQEVTWLFWAALKTSKALDLGQLEAAHRWLSQRDCIEGYATWFGSSRIGQFETLEWSKDNYQRRFPLDDAMTTLSNDFGPKNVWRAIHRFGWSWFENYQAYGPELPKYLLRLAEFDTREERYFRSLKPDASWVTMKSGSPILNGAEPEGWYLSRVWESTRRFVVGFMEKLAHDECLRRLTMNALAIEIHRLKTGGLPTKLDEVDGIFPDFATGISFKYEALPDGGYILYSVGTDGEDNGGVLPSNLNWYPESIIHTDPCDVVWPRLATGEEIDRWREAEWRKHWRRGRAYENPSEDEKEPPIELLWIAHFEETEEEIEARDGRWAQIWNPAADERRRRFEEVYGGAHYSQRSGFESVDE